MSNAVLDCQNGTNRSLSTDTYLLTLLLNFFGIIKNPLEIMSDPSSFPSKIRRWRFSSRKQRLLLWHILNQIVSLHSRQLLKLCLWNLDLQNLGVFAKNLISYFQILLEKLTQNIYFNLYHWIRLEKYSEKA